MAKGILSYTQHTVAFPYTPLGRGVVEDIGVSLDAFGGGTHSEFRFALYRFSNSSAWRAMIFTDGVKAFRATGDLFDELARNLDATPDDLVAMLEVRGARPSRYHLKGMAESVELSYDELQLARARISWWGKRERSEQPGPWPTRKERA